jgi:hypothetical protein
MYKILNNLKYLESFTGKTRIEDLKEERNFAKCCIG